MAKRNTEQEIHDFAHSIGRLVRRTRAAADGSGLSWSEASVLNRLGKLGPTTTAALARFEGMTPQSMRMNIAELEKRKLIERRPHETDGRQVIIQLTERGSKMQKEVREAKMAWLADAFKLLEREEQDLLLAAGKILNKMVESTENDRRYSG